VIPFTDRARIISVASGKGGAGKTNVSVNLAVAFAQAGDNTLLIDCDMGLANAAILLGMPSAWTIGDLIAGRCRVDDLLQTGPAGLHFIPGHSGTGSGSTLSAAERARLMDALDPHMSDYDHIVIDTGGGIEASALALVATADTPLIVLTPEPTSFVDAYAVVKALNVAHGTTGFDIVANMVRHDVAGRALFDRFRSIVARFLDIDLSYAGAIPADNYVKEAVLRKRCVVETFPGAPAARAFAALARRLAAPAPMLPPRPDPIMAEAGHGAH
jgi:flagellar biosynthesis protein FlhG